MHLVMVRQVILFLKYYLVVEEFVVVVAVVSVGVVVVHQRYAYSFRMTSTQNFVNYIIAKLSKIITDLNERKQTNVICKFLTFDTLFSVLKNFYSKMDVKKNNKKSGNLSKSPKSCKKCRGKDKPLGLTADEVDLSVKNI